MEPHIVLSCVPAGVSEERREWLTIVEHGESVSAVEPAERFCVKVFGDAPEPHSDTGLRERVSASASSGNLMGAAALVRTEALWKKCVDLTRVECQLLVAFQSLLCLLVGGSARVGSMLVEVIEFLLQLVSLGTNLFR
ncbi:hypothetical protein [Rhodococcus sp. ABRD24]|uniref:hypothetical protein n=1 Tax=Rhodococcus sp. ABRD24 TaxID=2507582 RepID=UPI0013F15952|nr:hypothetical protein [Rhodococcus sp. ABRD24]